jgi:hypothetical protein
MQRIFSVSARQSARLHRVDAPSIVLSLAHHANLTRIALRYTPFARRTHVKRIEHVINGREYQIEVSHVASHKWRAQIARVPGGSTATMPFYGKTPDEAAGQLSRWLSIANGTPRSPV